MGSLADLAAHLAAASRRLKRELEEHTLQKPCELLVTEIKSAIGTYKYGWPALAETTVDRKGADTPLLETGEYQASFHYVLGHDEAWVGSDDPKINWFENGTSRMPPRPVLLPALLAKKDDIEADLGGTLSASILK